MSSEENNELKSPAAEEKKELNYSCINVFVSADRNKELFLYLDNIAHKSNNLYNAALFRLRQCLTMANKTEEQLSDNEKEIRAEFEKATLLLEEKNKAIEKYNAKRQEEAPVKKSIKTVLKPTKSGFVSYPKLDLLLRLTENPDYCDSDLSGQCAQNVVKQACSDIKSFFESVKEYKVNPDRFTGKPELPDYKHKGGITTFTFSNQNCKIRENDKHHWVMIFPKTKLVLSLGKEQPSGRLKEVHVSPMYGKYKVSLVFENEEFPELLNTGNHIGIDIGVNNLMAVVSNCSFPCMLFNGRPVKAINQLFNKKHSSIVSEATKGGKKYIAAPEDEKLSLWRYNSIRDYFFKSVKQLMTLCVENRIDTIVIGHNTFWKQESNIGKTNNQNFCAIPFNDLIDMVEYQGKRLGIKVIVREESYTSQASFIDRDDIPTYGKVQNPKFSGKRTRRVYKTKNGISINADLNGAANILRKEFPEDFMNYNPDFTGTVLVRHPEYWNCKKTRSKNCRKNLRSAEGYRAHIKKVIPLG